MKYLRLIALALLAWVMLGAIFILGIMTLFGWHP